MTKKNKKIKQMLLQNPKLIHQLSYEGFSNFMLFYMSHLFTYKLGIFQLYMMRDVLSDIKDIVCPTFPDSYSEEIFMYSYVLWSILGVNKFTNCVIVCGTREKAKEVYLKFKNELLNNPELKKFNHKVTETSCDGWNIYVEGFNARISILSYPIPPSRIRHKRRSPDVVICCDLDDSFDDPRTIVSWMRNELYDKKHFYQKTIVFGNMNRENNLFDEIVMIGTNERDRRENLKVTITPCPLFGENKECFWNERYSKKDIEEMLKNWNDEKWQRKYLLHTYQTFKVPKEYFNEDGVCDVEGYKKYLDIHKDDRELFFDGVMHEVSTMREADYYELLQKAIKYRGLGVVIKYEPQQ